MAKFKVEIDHNVCQGFGACAELCSEFHVGDDVKSHVNGGKEASNIESLELETLDCHKQAAEACPYNAIHITNLETGEKLV